MDAVLALIPLFIILASVSSMADTATPAGFQLIASERLAQDTLLILDRNGSLRDVSIKYQTGIRRGDVALQNEAMADLNESLNVTLPDYLRYEVDVVTPEGTFNLTKGNPSLAENIISISSTTVGPPEGWAGFAWYKVEEANFIDMNRTSVSTAWNFHNWLSNFYTDYCTPGVGWGDNGNTISFSIPANATLHNAYYMLGAGSQNADPYDAGFYINEGIANISAYPGDDYLYLYTRIGGMEMYNSRMGVPVNTSPALGVMAPGSNNMRLDFYPPDCSSSNDDMPWFSLLANYTNPVPTPENMIVKTFTLPNVEGFAVDQTDGNDFDFDGSDEYGLYMDIYDENGNGSTTDYVYIEGSAREINWYDGDAAWANAIATGIGGGARADDGRSFAISQGGGDGLPGGDGGSAISSVVNFTIPTGVTVKDATLNLNLYGGVDNARVEVYDNTTASWVTIFNSFNLGVTTYSARADGYGNLPGKLNIDPSYITPGLTNQVRVTIWDLVPSTDWDWVGIVDSTITVSYTNVLQKWVNFPFTSYQDSNNFYQDTRDFQAETGTKEVLLFIGAGLDTRNLQVEIKNTTSSYVTLYNSNVTPYMVNLAELDGGLASAQHRLTTNTSNSTDYEVIEGNYTVRVSVTGPTYDWESGDFNREAELYSGTKVAVLYPEFINVTSVDTYNETADEAMQSARVILSGILNNTLPTNVSPNDPNMFAEATFVGGEPFTTYIILKVWNQ